ncbi:Hsp20/alpha crystallin family protein [Patulibacter sp. NPDC049589]|uniref:Hsp20/alpha crystallin family protein n=1 Tax=Patulibacter sp. NPDC049589 TaxID=3154731 RepID=UPI0034430BF8
MTIVRWEPARDFASLQQDVNRVFASFFDPSTTNASAGSWIPPVDLEELDDSFLLIADLPGVAEDDVAIDVEGDTLTLSGARTRARSKGARAVRTERGSGAFQRRLTMPEGVDADEITATFDRGVLEIRIPKPAKSQPRRVSIQVADKPRTLTHGESEAGKTDPAAESSLRETPQPAGAVA